jgi:diguanylate cyclase (GGDEF)-like protein
VTGDPLRDDETGLLNEAYFRAALPNRVATARRVLRPISIVIAKLADATAARQVAFALLDTLRESDTACRLDDVRMAMILEDTPENGAVWTVERLRRRMADQHRDLTMWAGVACYPAHAFDAHQIVDQAQRALTAARDWRQDRIEVATVPDD